MKLPYICSMFVACALLAASQAFAQHGPLLTPEERANAWAAQARGVATEEALDDDQTRSMVEAYRQTRERRLAIQNELQTRGLQGEQYQRAYNEALRNERARFRNNLRNTFDEAQTDRIANRLDAYDDRADLMTDTINRLDLDERQRRDALNRISDHVSESQRVRREALTNRDYDAARQQIVDSKRRLDNDMASVLTEEQIAQWRANTNVENPDDFQYAPPPGTRTPGAAPDPAEGVGAGQGGAGGNVPAAPRDRSDGSIGTVPPESIDERDVPETP